MNGIAKAEKIPDTGYVSVACKLPNGLRLDHEIGRQPSQRDAGGREVPGQPIEETFATLRGWSIEQGAPAFHVIGGYGITHHVDAAKFSAWYERMSKAKYPPVMNNMIFAMAKQEDVLARAEEQAEIPMLNKRLDGDKPGPLLEKGVRE